MPLIEHNGPGFGYRVYWKNNISENNWDSKVVDNYTINELSINNQSARNNTIVVRVVAFNDIGESTEFPIEVFKYVDVHGKF